MPSFHVYASSWLEPKIAGAGRPADLLVALAEGAVIRDSNNRPPTPAAPASVRKLIDCLAPILGEAIEDDYNDRNPGSWSAYARGGAQATRTLLEMDELVALIDAAADQETRSADTAALPRGESAAAVAASWMMSQVGHADSNMTMDVYASCSSESTASTGGRSRSSGRRVTASTATRSPDSGVNW